MTPAISPNIVSFYGPHYFQFVFRSPRRSTRFSAELDGRLYAIDSNTCLHRPQHLENNRLAASLQIEMRAPLVPHWKLHRPKWRNLDPSCMRAHWLERRIVGSRVQVSERVTERYLRRALRSVHQRDYVAGNL